MDMYSTIDGLMLVGFEKKCINTIIFHFFYFALTDSITLTNVLFIIFYNDNDFIGCVNYDSNIF